ncbi:hypothetical protein caldi_35090 [Caldinitratiruptor microaerophilus]|uniref:MoaD/ThiS family protein n=1 Tax=Caldinitratiruptor microaerophilus TaxID=671077 RepID=A0AA35GBK7_9FIRM|nr:hypothetical protein caldi_35090 [Caldinitratiruptor microaerophilus]
MVIRLHGDLARAAGEHTARLSLESPLTVREVVTVLRGLYPGLGVGLDGRAGRVVVLRNRLPCLLDDPVTDGDLLDLIPEEP